MQINKLIWVNDHKQKLVQSDGMIITDYYIN